MDKRQGGLPVTVKGAIKQAKTIHQSLHPTETFPGSKCWWYGFAARNGLSMRMKTTQGQTLPEHHQKELVKFLGKLHRHR